MSSVDLATTGVERWARVQRLFERALDVPPEERRELVEAEAKGDPRLVASVLELLAHDEDPSLLDRPVAGRLGVLAGVEPWQVGDRLGQYRLLEEIGAGGMGVVFRAEHLEGLVRQEVAIKVLYGPLLPEARERFVQEQRILAAFEHPRIARLQDFGSTPSGSTFLVMNLIRGTTILDFADERCLSVAERIELFLQVGDAVDYGHQRLVVHRDLKPANILVTDPGEVQLVDFGIAKILDPQEHLGGSVTQTAQRVLTPSYASPEQLLGRWVTTGTDVWSLGVLLFELLTGRRPFDWAGRSLVEIEQELRHQLRPKASVLFAGDDPETCERARRRSSDPGRLRRRLKGDLDHIVAHALGARPEERYGSVEALARDLRRHLQGRTILAQPPSLTDRAVKFVRRHALEVTALVTAVVCLAAFSFFLWLQSERLTQQRDLARQQRDNAEWMQSLVSDAFDLADPSLLEPSPAARRLLDQSRQRIVDDTSRPPALRADLLAQLGSIYHRLGDLENAETVLAEALEARRSSNDPDPAASAQILDRLGYVYYLQRDPRALETLHTALRQLWSAHGGDHSDIARSLAHLALALNSADHLAEAHALVLRAHAMDRRLGIDGSPEAADRLVHLATLTGRRGARDEALRLFDQALGLQRQTRGDDSVQYGLALNRMSLLFQERPQAEEGVLLLEEALAIFRQRLDEDHSLVAAGLHNLAHSYLLLGRYDQAEASIRQAEERDRRRLGAEHPHVWGDRHLLAVVLRESGRPEESFEVLEEATQAFARTLAAGHPLRLEAETDHARLLLERGEGMLALSRLGAAREAAVQTLGTDHWISAVIDIGLAEHALAEGDLEMALDRSRRAVAVLSQESIGRERWRLGEARSVLGTTLARLGRVEEGHDELRAAVSWLSELRGNARVTQRAEERLQSLED